MLPIRNDERRHLTPVVEPQPREAATFVGDGEPRPPPVQSLDERFRDLGTATLRRKERHRMEEFPALVHLPEIVGRVLVADTLLLRRSRELVLHRTRRHTTLAGASRV